MSGTVQFNRYLVGGFQEHTAIEPQAKQAAKNRHQTGFILSGLLCASVIGTIPGIAALLITYARYRRDCKVAYRQFVDLKAQAICAVPATGVSLDAQEITNAITALRKAKKEGFVVGKRAVDPLPNFAVLPNPTPAGETP